MICEPHFRVQRNKNSDPFMQHALTSATTQDAVGSDSVFDFACINTTRPEDVETLCCC